MNEIVFCYDKLLIKFYEIERKQNEKNKRD